MKRFFRILLTSFTCLIASETIAQSLPDITYEDYGFNKPVKQVEEMYYSLDGDSIERVEKVIRRFTAQGNIESYENKSFLDDSWSKSKMSYKKTGIHKESWQTSNPYLNRTYTYQYDKQGKIVEEKIRFKGGSKSHIQFTYEDDLLKEIEADIEGVQSATTRYYSGQGKLYKEIHRQKTPGEEDIITNYFYLEGKEILSYIEPGNYFYANAYLYGIAEFKFRLVEDSAFQNKLLQGILQYDQEAPLDNLPFRLKEYSEQTIQAYDKNKEILVPYQVTLFIRNNDNQIIAEAEVDIKNKTIAGIGFFRVEYADGTITGNTEYDPKVQTSFENLLIKIDLF